MLRTIAFLFITALVSAGCTSNQLLRTAGTADCNDEPASIPDDCKTSSIEVHHDYLLSVVEFDEQGWFRDRRQQDKLFEKLNQIGKTKDMIIVAFVHGWKHNADYCDTNMCCFRDMLQQISVLEEQYSPDTRTRRQVVGVYLGWRGLSLEGKMWENLSFWTRKETATRVALGSSRELLARLRDFQARQNSKRVAAAASMNVKDRAEPSRAKEGPDSKVDDASQPPRARTRLITVGHSFGGLIVYSAIAQSLLNSGLDDDGRPADTPVKGFGDLVVLVNPAVEAARYEPVYSVVEARKEYPFRQTPVFVAVTSEDDKATAVAFPAGRWLSSRFESYSGSPDVPPPGYGYSQDDEKQADWRTIGHIDRYTTHTLFPLVPSGVAAPQKQAQPCTCPYADEIKKITAEKIKLERAARKDQFCKWAQQGKIDGWEREYGKEVMLKHKSGHAASPFWIVKTRSPIIPDHNEFYTPLFMNFLRGLYDDVLSGPTFDVQAC